MSFGFFRRVASTRAAFPEWLEIDGSRIPLVVTASPRARRLTLRADPARAIVRLTLPRGVSTQKALAFLADHNTWLTAQIAKWPQALPLCNGVRLPLGDSEIVIEWSASRPRMPQLAGDRLWVGGPEQGLSGRIERWLKAEALAALTVDSQALTVRIGLPPAPVRVGDPKGRWGSCSARGGLVYSWRLILAPVFVRRAVAAHEVAHLVHHNHGPAFHRLADELSEGTAKSSSRWLAANGAALHWIGRR